MYNRRSGLRFVVLLLGIATLFFVSSCAFPPYPSGGPFELPADDVVLSFSVASDMRSYAGPDRRYFRSAAERLADGGPGSFMISAGDIDPPDVVYDTLQAYIGADYGWFPVVGNHEAETTSDMEYLRAQEWKMQVVQGEEIAALPDILQAWTGAGRRGEG